jgi:hypothetical protein
VKGIYFFLSDNSSGYLQEAGAGGNVKVPVTVLPVNDRPMKSFSLPHSSFPLSLSLSLTNAVFFQNYVKSLQYTFLACIRHLRNLQGYFAYLSFIFLTGIYIK